jgi:hypothetical protein
MVGGMLLALMGALGHLLDLPLRKSKNLCRVARRATCLNERLNLDVDVMLSRSHLCIRLVKRLLPMISGTLELSLRVRDAHGRGFDARLHFACASYGGYTVTTCHRVPPSFGQLF